MCSHESWFGLAFKHRCIDLCIVCHYHHGPPNPSRSVSVLPTGHSSQSFFIVLREVLFVLLINPL